MADAREPVTTSLARLFESDSGQVLIPVSVADEVAALLQDLEAKEMTEQQKSNSREIRTALDRTKILQKERDANGQP